MQNLVPTFFFILVVAVIFSPIYFLNRKLRKMADQDLKNSDQDEWVRHSVWNSYAKSAGIAVCGSLLLYFFFSSLRYADSTGLSLIQILALLFGFLLILFAGLRFLRERKGFSQL